MTDLNKPTPNYEQLIARQSQQVFDILTSRCSECEIQRVRQAFELARRVHSGQWRKGGEPYILHPIAVAMIAANDMQLDADSVAAAFLHDVVEDTDTTIDNITQLFGNDVSRLVQAVTKQKKHSYESSLQVDNYKQMLTSMEYDIRAILIKLSDRLHNMRTLESMRPDKQMKIAGETDYFYAPLANRLGLYHIKTELENLSLRFRCPHEYDEISRLIHSDEEHQRNRLNLFCTQITQVLAEKGINVVVNIVYREPYSVWRKMQKFGDDFNHLKYRHFTDVIFKTPPSVSEKDMALRIYSILTDRFKEKPGGIVNYIDSPKENGYRSFHLKLLADFGRWQEVHISSEEMIRASRLGCIAERSTAGNITRWIEKFRNVLAEVVDQRAKHTDPAQESTFMDKVVTTFYNDDIMTFTPKGKPVVLPQRATVLDFAYEISNHLGSHAKCARVNSYLASVKQRLHRGDVVEIITDPAVLPSPERLDYVVTYKAKKAITSYLDTIPRPKFNSCTHCKPIPGEEVIGFSDSSSHSQSDTLTLHKRDCPVAIRLASQRGESIVSVDYHPHPSRLYPVAIEVRAIDRYHLFIDLVDCITNQLNLSMTSFNTDVVDSIATVHISFDVHSYTELQRVIKHIARIQGVDEVKRKS